MNKKPDFRVTIDDVDQEIYVAPRDILWAEREGYYGLEGGSRTVEGAYKLAHHASRTEVPFEEWIDSLQDFDILEAEDEKKDGDETEGVPPTTGD